MPQRISFTVTAWSPAKPSDVYRLLQDGASWPVWSPIGSFQLEREGRDGGESEGAIRAFKTGTVRSREEIVALRPDRALSYVALSGLPICAHRADVDLTPHDEGTTITWNEVFEPKIPGSGRVLRWFLQGFIQRCANGLATHARDTPSVSQSGSPVPSTESSKS